MAQILIIDDDPDVRGLLEQTLTTAGYKVTLAADGQEGLANYHKSPANLVITDLYMPNREGLETIKDLRRLFPDLPIIAMSGKPTAETMLHVAEQLGAVQVLQKPFTAEELLEAVRKTL